MNSSTTTQRRDLPHSAQRMASALADVLKRNGIELSQAELLQLFRFWVEPGGGFWIRRHSDGVEISFHQFVVECCAELLRKDFVQNHGKGEIEVSSDPKDTAREAKRSFVSPDPADAAKQVKNTLVQPDPSDIADAIKKEHLRG